MANQITQQELDQAFSLIEANGFEVTQRADQFGNKPYLVVQDPIHACGTGSSAGKLVLVGYEPVIVRDYRAAFRFVDARS